MNDNIKVIGKFKDAVSEYIPKELDVMIKLAKIAFDTFGKDDNSLTGLYKDVFKNAVENVIASESADSILKLLKQCKSINSSEDVLDLFGYCNKICIESGLSVSKADISNIADKITRQFEVVLLEEKYDKLYRFLQYNQSNFFNSELEKINDKLDEILNHMNFEEQLKTHNKLFASSFIEELCKHRTCKIMISLKDLFIVPNVKMDCCDTVNILTVISDFVNNDNENVLFLEGYGGYGKSSIVSYLAYNYELNNSAPAISFLNDRQLITIRMRDIRDSNKVKGIEELFNNLSDIKNNSILIFDGLDELCMVEKRNSGTEIANSIINNFLLRKRKIIITSRPTYVDYSKFDLNITVKYKKVELLAFDDIQRNEFAALFEKKIKDFLML